MKMVELLPLEVNPYIITFTLYHTLGMKNQRAAGTGGLAS